MSGGVPIVYACYNWIPLGYRQITNLSTAIGLGAIPQLAIMALISAESQDVRWRDDQTDPTATVGMPLAAGQEFQYTGNFYTIKFIEQAASAALNISFYK